MLDIIQARLDGLETRLKEVQKEAMRDGHINWLESIQINGLKGTIATLRLLVGEKEQEQSSSSSETTSESSSSSSETTTTSTSVETHYDAAEKAAEVGLSMAEEQHYQAGYAGPDGYWVPPDFTTKIEAGEKIPSHLPQPTWCNRFAMDLAEEILGEDNPFKDLNKNMASAGKMNEFMNEREDLFEKVDTFEKAWEEANKGKMVFLSDSGHIATCIPTDEMQSRQDASGKVWTFGEVIQAGASVGQMYLNYAWGVNSFKNIEVFVTKNNGEGAEVEVEETTETTEPTDETTETTTDDDSSTTPSASAKLSASVGAGGVNNQADVLLVQETLNDKRSAGLTEDGLIGPATIGAIKAFQQATFGWADGRIDVGGQSEAALFEAVSDTGGTTSDDTTDEPGEEIVYEEGELGIGDDGDETYKDQRDNPVLGDATCNVTTLAMQLLGLANGDEARVMESALELCSKHGVSGVNASTQLEEILRRLTIVAAGEERPGGIPAWQWSWVLDKTAEMFTDIVLRVDNASKYTNITTKEAYMNQIVPELQKGAEVMVSNHLTSGGHIVFLVAVRDDGIVINDPYGMMVTNHGYCRNAEQISSGKKAWFTTYKTIIDTRLKLNSSLKSAILTQVENNGTFPNNTGEKNFYTWDEVATYKIGKWCNVALKA